MLEETDLFRVIIVVSFFIYASKSDWKTRRVKDITWIVLGTLALMVLWVDLLDKNASAISQSILLPIAFVFYDIFWDREEGAKTSVGLIALILYILAFAWILYVSYTLFIGSADWSEEISGPLIAFIMIVLFEILYIFDIIKGGADAKALICLAILFPWYPQLFDNLPIIMPQLEVASTIFVFALSVLFIAALISVTIPLYFLLKNVKSGQRITARSLVGFTIPIDDVKKHFVWLIEWIEDGNLKFSARKPRDSETLEDDLEALQSYGKKDIWVTYKIPFIIPMTAAIIIVLSIGNPLFLLY